jgi:hypothetical protein
VVLNILSAGSQPRKSLRETIPPSKGKNERPTIPERLKSKTGGETREVSGPRPLERRFRAGENASGKEWFPCVSKAALKPPQSRRFATSGYFPRISDLETDQNI